MRHRYQPCLSLHNWQQYTSLMPNTSRTSIIPSTIACNVKYTHISQLQYHTMYTGIFTQLHTIDNNTMPRRMAVKARRHRSLLPASYGRRRQTCHTPIDAAAALLLVRYHVTTATPAGTVYHVSTGCRPPYVTNTPRHTLLATTVIYYQ